ncbi:MAG: hypothetical protein ACE5F6_19625 [Anaerolineae bacterium]
MIVKTLIILMLGFWAVLALWPELRGRLYQPAPVRAERPTSRRPGGGTW